MNPQIEQRRAVQNSALTDDWGTDPNIFDTLNKEFHFNLDVCADATNHKCERYFTRQQDALTRIWAPSRFYCNPPFSLNYEFVKKGKQECHDGAFGAFLIPARTNRSWFFEFVWDKFSHRPYEGVQIRFYQGAIPYIGTHGSGAPFPVMLIVMKAGLPL